ncbi:glycosyltransferase [Citreimonas salinaria]|uniref:Glycosyltransferase, GT2 family n=1 Tax=Citreimonas salinaria TaxID=321339 RepID=A0A1H3N484_9RHOB|nr:glycosyltransferase [Citreimonas salinaria]SDY83510.1 Glycosyltransferase, GT2 family [Citreimonas salinaria]
MSSGGAGRLVAVVVTHDRLAALRVTLARLLAAPADALHAVVVVDNASTDGTAAWLAAQDDPRLRVHRLAVNGGGAGGFAAGMALAREAFDPDWIVVMDDDARPEPGALEAFHAANPGRWDAVAAAVYFPDGRICEMNRPSRNPFWHGRAFAATALRGRGGFHLPPGAYAAPDPVEIDVTSFVGFFVSRAGMDRAGLPDPGLFLYGDDGIYTLELRRAGGRMAFLPQVRFEHACGTFGSAQRGRFLPLWKVYYYHRNLLLLYRLAAGPVLFWPAAALVLPKWFAKARHHPASERRAFARLMARAVAHGLARRTGTAHGRVLGWARTPEPGDRKRPGG